MAVDETRIVIQEQLTAGKKTPEEASRDRVLLGMLQSVKQWTEGKRIEAVNDLTQTISNPPTQAQVQAIQDKVNELLQALRSNNSNILDS